MRWEQSGKISKDCRVPPNQSFLTPPPPPRLQLHLQLSGGSRKVSQLSPLLRRSNAAQCFKCAPLSGRSPPEAGASPSGATPMRRYRRAIGRDVDRPRPAARPPRRLPSPLAARSPPRRKREADATGRVGGGASDPPVDLGSRPPTLRSGSSRTRETRRRRPRGFRDNPWTCSEATPPYPTPPARPTGRTCPWTIT